MCNVQKTSPEGYSVFLTAFVLFLLNELPKVTPSLLSPYCKRRITWVFEYFSVLTGYCHRKWTVHKLSWRQWRQKWRSSPPNHSYHPHDSQPPEARTRQHPWLRPGRLTLPTSMGYYSAAKWERQFYALALQSRVAGWVLPKIRLSNWALVLYLKNNIAVNIKCNSLTCKIVYLLSFPA